MFYFIIATVIFKNDFCKNNFIYLILLAILEFYTNLPLTCDQKFLQTEPVNHTKLQNLCNMNQMW